jgi:hypothetical protein
MGGDFWKRRYGGVMPTEIVAALVLNAFVCAFVAVAVRGSHPAGRAFAWGFFFGEIGILAVILLTIRAALAPQPPAPDAPPDYGASAETLQQIADRKAVGGPHGTPMPQAFADPVPR